MSLKILKYRLQEASSDGTDPGAGAGTDPSPSADKWQGMANELLSDEGTDWGDLDADTPAGADDAPAAPAPKTDAVPTPAEPAPAQQPQAAPPEQPKAQETIPEPSAEPQPTAEPAVDLSAQRSTLRTTLVQRYALNEEMAEKALTDPGSVLPELAADLQLNVTEAVTYGIMSILPQILESHLKQREVTQQGEAAFFGKWQDLNTPQGRQAVQQFGAAFRNLNPKATAQEFIEKVGAAAMLSLGLNPGVQEAPPSVPTANLPPPPAAPGGASPLPRPAGSTNKFAVLAEELISDTDD